MTKKGKLNSIKFHESDIYFLRKKLVRGQQDTGFHS